MPTSCLDCSPPFSLKNDFPYLDHSLSLSLCRKGMECACVKPKSTIFIIYYTGSVFVWASFFPSFFLFTLTYPILSFPFLFLCLFVCVWVCMTFSAVYCSHIKCEMRVVFSDIQIPLSAYVGERNKGVHFKYSNVGTW